MRTNDLRINTPVRISYKRKDGTVGGYDGKVSEHKPHGILVELDRDGVESKAEFRYFHDERILSCITGY